MSSRLRWRRRPWSHEDALDDVASTHEREADELSSSAMVHRAPSSTRSSSSAPRSYVADESCAQQLRTAAMTCAAAARVRPTCHEFVGDLAGVADLHDGLRVATGRVESTSAV